MNIEEKIINFVKENDFLYDKTKRNYRNLILRENKWNILAQQLNIEVQIVKRRWRTLRDAYLKEKKKIQNSYKGMGEPYTKKWKFFDLMTFIDVTPIEKLTSVKYQPNDDPLVLDDAFFETAINYSEGFENTKFGVTNNDDADEFSSKIIRAKEQMNQLFNLTNYTSKSTPIQLFFQALASQVEAANLPQSILGELQVSLLQKITSTLTEQSLTHENN